MPSVLVPIADGTEELEAITIIDCLRRAGIEVTVASVMTAPQVTAANGTRLVADCMMADCAGQSFDMITLPGGLPGADHLAASDELKQLLLKQHQADGWVTAICASPAVVLGAHGLTDGKNATCYPGFESGLSNNGATVQEEKVVIDGKLITSRGPATALPFALELITQLCGADKSQEVASGLLAN